MNFDLVLKGGRIVTLPRSFLSDMGILNQSFSALGRYLAPDNICPVYNIKNRKIIPLLRGFLSFVPFNLSGQLSSDSLYSQTHRNIVHGFSSFNEIIFSRPNETLEATVARAATELEIAKLDNIHEFGCSIYLTSGVDLSLNNWSSKIADAQKMGLHAVILDCERFSEEEIFDRLVLCQQASCSVIVSSLNLQWPRKSKGLTSSLNTGFSKEGSMTVVAKLAEIARIAKAKVFILGVFHSDVLTLIKKYQREGVLIYPLIFIHNLLPDISSEAIHFDSRLEKIIPPVQNSLIAKSLFENWLSGDFRGGLVFGSGGVFLKESPNFFSIIYYLFCLMIKNGVEKDNAWCRISSELNFSLGEKYLNNQLLIGENANFLVVDDSVIDNIFLEEIKKYFKGKKHNLKNINPDLVVFKGRVVAENGKILI